MRQLITFAAATALLSCAVHVAAEEVPEFGANAEEGLAPVEEEGPEEDANYLGELTMGFRLGYSLPFGNIRRDGDGVSMDEAFTGHLPLWFDIGYEPLPNLMLGGYGIWGPASMAASDTPSDPNTDVWGCVEGASCFGNIFRGGGQIQWQFSPNSKLNPWVGAGAAYEFAFARAKAGGVVSRRLLRGPEIIMAELGLDVKPNQDLGIGPFVSFSVNRYTNCKIKIDGEPGPRCDIEERAQHMYVYGGVRVYFSAIQVRKKGVNLTPP